MNFITKICLTATLASSTIAFSQENSIVVTNIPSSINQDYQFKGNWLITTVNESNTIFNLTGNQLFNYSKWTSNNLILDLYFVSTNSTVDLQSLTNKLDRTTKLGKIAGEGSAVNNLSITFHARDLYKFNNGDYTAIVVLKDTHNKNAIISYKVVENKIKHENQIVSLVRPMQQIAPISVVNTTAFVNDEKLDNTLSNIYTTVGSELDLTKVSNDVKLSGDWKLEVDFDALSVSIDGINNAIENHKGQSTRNLKLMVYFASEEVTNSNIGGYELLNIDIQPIKSHAMIRGTKIKTNITKSLPTGEYYPLLVLTEQNENGEYVIKSAVKFKEKYQL